MNPSQLQLERHFFTKVRLDAHTDGKPETPNVLKAQLMVGQANENPKRFQLTLSLELLPPPEQIPAYSGEIHAVGFFRVNDSCPQEMITKLVEVNGAAILYGAIREMILNLTSRGPWPGICLNSVTFLRSENGLTTEGTVVAKDAKPYHV